MSKIFAYSIFCVLFFPSLVCSQEYTIFWGGDTQYETKNDAMNVLFLRSVTDATAQILRLSRESERYNAYQAYFADSFLQYIIEYTEKEQVALHEDVLPHKEDEKNNPLFPVSIDVIVNTVKIRNTLEELGALQSKTSPITYKVEFDKNASSVEKEFLEKQLHMLEIVSDITRSTTAPIRLQVWSIKGDARYSGILLSENVRYTATSTSLNVVWKTLWGAYWKAKSPLLEQGSNLATKMYKLEVQKVQTTQGVSLLDEAFTKKLSDTVDDLTLSDIVSTGETFTAIWICTVKNELEFVTIIRSILSLYPTVTYRLITHKPPKDTAQSI